MSKGDRETHNLEEVQEGLTLPRYGPRPHNLDEAHEGLTLPRGGRETYIKYSVS